MNKLLPHGVIAATIAGASIGTASGFMVKGEQLEEQGAGELKQLTGSIGQGVQSGLIGTGIGLGAGEVVNALSSLMRKR